LPNDSERLASAVPAIVEASRSNLKWAHEMLMRIEPETLEATLSKQMEIGRLSVDSPIVSLQNFQNGRPEAIAEIVTWLNGVDPQLKRAAHECLFKLQMEGAVPSASERPDYFVSLMRSPYLSVKQILELVTLHGAEDVLVSDVVKSSVDS